ncbi:MAG TPA: zinc-binding dehydrogenase [Pseudomonadales bacterium]|nr:zinc-binding dehydrogenase [Pseudomonadales bacterium]
MTIPAKALQLRSLIGSDGFLELSLAEVEVPKPAADEVLVRVEASPINPSDLGLLFGGADMSKAEFSGSGDAAKVRAPVPEAMLRASKPRHGNSLPVGNEGAGTVVATGSDADAKALEGRVVAILGGAMYGQYRAVKAKECLLLPEGTTPAQGASCFVNPLTALGMTETMKREGHTALVHTAAASNLGQMLQKICIADGIELVNIVRKPEQEALLRDIGAKQVVDSSKDSFMGDLVDALAATGATIGFDAIGGGDLASRILTGMEQAAARNGTGFSIYGSTTHKQVYIYGGLDRGPTILNRAYGMAWSLGGWLLPPFLAKIGPEAAQALRQRVADEITTTFASHYTAEIPLAGVLSEAAVKTYGRMATGEKYLVTPNA